MPTAPTTADLLTEAQAAEHRLLTGAAIAEVHDQNGESVSYAKIDLPGLRSYIERLKAQIAAATSVCDPLKAVRPLRVYL